MRTLPLFLFLITLASCNEQIQSMVGKKKEANSLSSSGNSTDSKKKNKTKNSDDLDRDDDLVKEKPESPNCEAPLFIEKPKDGNFQKPSDKDIACIGGGDQKLMIMVTAPWCGYCSRFVEGELMKSSCQTELEANDIRSVGLVEFDTWKSKTKSLNKYDGALDAAALYINRDAQTNAVLDYGIHDKAFRKLSSVEKITGFPRIYVQDEEGNITYIDGRNRTCDAILQALSD